MIKKTSIIAYLIVSSIFFNACQMNKELEPTSYVIWVESKENGLRQEKKMGEIRYILQYQPQDYIALKELEADKLLDQKKFEAIKGELGSMEYYKLRIESVDGIDIEKLGTSSPDEFMQRSNYLSFGLQTDIVMVNEKDTVPCALFHNSKNYGLAPYVDFALAFVSPEQNNQDHEVIINDNAYHNKVKFQIKSRSLNNIPALKLQR